MGKKFQWNPENKKIFWSITAMILAAVLIACKALYNVHAYTTQTASESRTYQNGWATVYVKGPSGTSSVNIKFTYSGNKVTQDKFRDSSRTISMTTNNTSSPNPYNLKLSTSSAKTRRNSGGNYTWLDFNMTYTLPAHEQGSSETGSFPSGQKFDSNFVSVSSHGISGRTVAVKCTVSVYSIGVVTYYSGGKYYRYYGSALELNCTRPKYKLTFDANGGSVGESARWVTDGVEVGELPTPWRTGYDFRGWTWGRIDPNNSFGYPNAGDDSWICSDTTFYASWEASTYNITYDSNGGTGSMDPTTATYNQDVTLNNNQFTKKGYRFDGWSTSQDGASVYSNSSTFKWTRTSDLTLYARWIKDNYVVSFDGNGSGGTMDEVRLKYGQASELPVNTFKRSGYTFIGWSLNSEDVKPKYADKASINNPVDKDGNEIDAGEEMKLYAVWKKSDSSFNTDNLIHDDKMFLGDIYLEGGNGTGYNNSKTDSEYARIDRTGIQGYFTNRW